jgi:2-keto-3-deoxy-L-rhamnonate aldolase RhmA
VRNLACHADAGLVNAAIETRWTTVTLATRLANDKPAFGITLTIADPFIAEVIAGQALDFLMVDTEHAPVSAYQLQTQLIALRTSAATLLVRVAENNAAAIGHVLDLGAHGVVVPQVETADDCRRAVSAALYPPRGSRGFGPRRASRLGQRSRYLADANDSTFVGIMIESATALNNLDQILAVDGVGAVIIGARDLAASLGYLTEPEHADVRKSIDLVVERCAAANVPFGMFAASAAAAADLLSRGARIITVGSDLLFFESGMRRVLDSLSPLRDWRIEPRVPGTGQASLRHCPPAIGPDTRATTGQGDQV